MSIHRKKNGYQIRHYDSDGIERKRTIKGVCREEAVRIEREILAARDRGEKLPDTRHAPSFKHFAATWKEEHRSGWKFSTLSQYEQVLKSQLLLAFGDLRVSNISESRIRQMITGLQDAGLGARRINLVLMVLRQILRAARRRHLIREDPMTEIRDLKEQSVDVDPLDPQEIETFLAHCPTWWRPYFVTAFWTGSRPNELAALKKSDFDWQGHTFRIRAGRYRGVESMPKTSSSVRDVDMLPAVVEALKAQFVQQAKGLLQRGEGTPNVGKDYVFTGPNGGLLNVNFLRDRVWYPTLAKAQLRRRTFYQTRHTFASNALAAGEAPSWVSRTLGHSSPEMLFRVYARYIPNRTRRDGSALAARMNKSELSADTDTAIDHLQVKKAE